MSSLRFPSSEQSLPWAHCLSLSGRCPITSCISQLLLLYNKSPQKVSDLKGQTPASYLTVPLNQEAENNEPSSWNQVSGSGQLVTWGHSGGRGHLAWGPFLRWHPQLTGSCHWTVGNSFLVDDQRNQDEVREPVTSLSSALSWPALC